MMKKGLINWPVSHDSSLALGPNAALILEHMPGAQENEKCVGVDVLYQKQE